MLNEYNERLDDLREKLARGSKLDSMLRELYAQRDELATRVGELSRELYMEQADVDRLTGGFWSIYYAVIGKKEKLLEKERAEVLKASMKYETAKKELDEVQKEIFNLDWEKGNLKRYQQEYDEVLAQKLEAMKKESVHAGEIADLEEKKAQLRAQIQEVNEALTAGRRVMRQIGAIEQSLDSAEGWGTLDTFFGGGVILDIAKYSHLDDAQRGVQSLQSMLRTFKTELADVSAVQADIRAEVGGFMRFADWFFDGLFVDLAVLSRIQESKESLRSTERQVQRVMDQLRQMEREMQRQQDRLEGEIRRLAEDA